VEVLEVFRREGFRCIGDFDFVDLPTLEDEVLCASAEVQHGVTVIRHKNIQPAIEAA
jgi:hypothetical protein